MQTGRLIYHLLGGVMAAQLGLTGTALATIAGGGGSSATDCLAVFDAPVNSPAPPRNVVCVDGDACDADGVVNGSCEIPLIVCANSTMLAGCSLNGVESITVEHALDNGDPKFDTEFQALQNRVDNGIQPPTTDADSCTSPTNFHVVIKGPVGANKCRHNTKKLKLTTVSKVISGRVYTDKDTIKITCEPSPNNGCNPQTLFAGTFDRIQTQIFNQSCAVSACHDSQSHQNGLILEVGASYTNLLNVDPTNGAARTVQHWKRVNQISPTMGDSSTSYLSYKLTGHFPNDGNDYGLRMPRKGPVLLNKSGRKLDSTLIDVIQLWIDAGAPQTGWVPGTF